MRRLSYRHFRALSEFERAAVETHVWADTMMADGDGGCPKSTPLRADFDPPMRRNFTPLCADPPLRRKSGGGCADLAKNDGARRALWLLRRQDARPTEVNPAAAQYDGLATRRGVVAEYARRGWKLPLKTKGEKK